jgi:hypothetical protein
MPIRKNRLFIAFLYHVFTIMEKLVNTRTFWKITVKNYDYRPTMSEDIEDFIPFLWGIARIKRKHYFRGRWERTYFYVNWELKACWSYTWINRSWQCFDFQSSIRNAMNYALEKLNWSEYEAIRGDLQAVKDYLKD